MEPYSHFQFTDRVVRFDLQSSGLSDCGTEIPKMGVLQQPLPQGSLRLRFKGFRYSDPLSDSSFWEEVGPASHTSPGRPDLTARGCRREDWRSRASFV